MGRAASASASALARDVRFGSKAAARSLPESGPLGSACDTGTGRSRRMCGSSLELRRGRHAPATVLHDRREPDCEAPAPHGRAACFVRRNAPTSRAGLAARGASSRRHGHGREADHAGQHQAQCRFQSKNHRIPRHKSFSLMNGSGWSKTSGDSLLWFVLVRQRSLNVSYGSKVDAWSRPKSGRSSLFQCRARSGLARVPPGRQRRLARASSAGPLRAC
jgi:hypothetical protein